MTGSRKLLSLACMLMLAAIVALSGCSSNGNNNDGASPSTSPSGEASGESSPSPEPSKAPELPPYKITMFVPGAGAPQDIKLVNEAISAHLKDKLNLSFELTVIEWASWQEKMNLKFASSEAFDLIWTVAWDGFTTKIKQKAIIDMTDLIDQFAPDAKQIINPALLEGAKYNGRNYSLPVNKEMASQRGILLRKDLVEKHGIDIAAIKTFEDLEPIYEKIKAAEPGVTPLYIDKGSNLPNMASVGDFDTVGGGKDGIVRGTSDYKVVSMVQSPQYRKWIDLARKWYLAGYVNKDAATTQDMGGALKAGKAFSVFDYLKPGKDAEVSTATGFDWVQVPLTKPIIATGDTTGSMMSISRTSKDPERVMQFLNLLYTDKELVNLLAFGIEGKHYAKVAGKDNVIDFPEGVTAQSSGYNLNSAYMFGNQFLDYLWANEDPKKWDNFKTFNDSAESSLVLGFNFDPEAVKNESAALANVAKEYDPGLVTGTLDPEEIMPKYIDKLRASGSEKVIAEKQKQLDAWRAAK
ncbi:ABC transporter substrate-binding protein [Cohnella sp. GCM10027633]|uniref:ABC transporter substrate-binding protein n=1 Tax=unclassified Cohnella TaxID=2636738 RepID=UPI0036404CDB